MSSAIYTGRDGYVNGVPCLQQWSVNEVGTNERYAASCTDYGTGVSSGNRNFTGSMAGIGNPPVTVFPGLDLTFKGVVLYATAGSAKTLDGTVRINSLNINAPIEGGGLPTWTANFGAQGALAAGTTGAIDSYGTDPVKDGCGTGKVVLGNSVTDLFGTRNWSLNFNAPEKPYIQNGLTYRKSGNLEGDFSIGVYNDEFVNAAFAINAYDFLRLYLNTSEYWEVDGCVFTGKSNFLVNRATQDLIGFTINGMWSAIPANGDNSVGLGYVKHPDGTFLFGDGPDGP